MVICATVLLAVRHLRGYEELHVAEVARAKAEAGLAVAEEHERAALALHAQEQRFDIALNNMLQGLRPRLIVMAGCLSSIGVSVACSACLTAC